MPGITDNQVAEAGSYQAYNDVLEELAFPTSIWNF
uniref:Uncharacterized protein n=1 Tax=Rhizophora mucronata TaxID=61149 RepID=A0A2P2PVM3_RHIMU